MKVALNGLLQNDFSPSLAKRKNQLNLLIKFRNNLLISIPASTSKKIEEKKEKRKVKRIILFFKPVVFGYSIKQMYLFFFFNSQNSHGGRGVMTHSFLGCSDSNFISKNMQKHGREFGKRAIVKHNSPKKEVILKERRSLEDHAYQKQILQLHDDKKMLSHKKKTNKQNKAVNDSTKNFVWDQR